MKKLIITFALLLTSVSIAHAEDCLRDPIYERDWNAVVTTGMRVRDIPCMESSAVLTTVPVGTVVKVIAETDGYFKVRLQDGTEGWSGQWLLEPTNQSFQGITSQEPLFDIKNHRYETAIQYLAEQDIIEGYPDGSFKPDTNVNRAEFVKILVGSILGYTPEKPANNCFPDVPRDAWFAPYVCYAENNGIIDGYPDGSFKPAETINLVEAAKILVNSMQLDTNSEIPAEPWYRIYIESLQDENFLPSTFSSLDQNVSRSEMSEMMWRIMEEKSDQPYSQFEFEPIVIKESSPDSTTN